MRQAESGNRLDTEEGVGILPPPQVQNVTHKPTLPRKNLPIQMARVVLNHISYALPFADLLPSQSASDLATLREHIRAHGVHVPILVGITPAHGRIVIDGVTRSRIAADLDLEVKLDDYGEVTDELALSLALALNAHRRHLDRTERDRVIVQLRGSGKSVRAIAALTGISKSTVNDRIRATREEPESLKTEEPQRRIVGLNGQHYRDRKSVVIARQLPDSLAREASELARKKLTHYLKVALEFGEELLSGPWREEFVEWLEKVKCADVAGQSWSGLRQAIEELPAVGK